MNATNTAKQQALRDALGTNPRAPGELIGVYCRRIAVIAGVHATYVRNTLIMDDHARVGADRRAKEEEEKQVAPFTGNLGMVDNFQGWIDVFGKYKLLTEAYLTLARQRGDVYAAAFLTDIKEVAERAQRRAMISKAD